MGDFTLHGRPTDTVFLLSPKTAAAETWLDEHVPLEAIVFGDAIAIEHRFVDSIVEGIKNDGLTVEWRHP